MALNDYFDPSGYTRDEGTFGNLLDPGSKAIESVLGEGAGNEARRLADPLGLLGGLKPPTIESGQLEAWLAKMTPEALAELFGGANQAAALTGQATEQAMGALQPFGGTQAFDERAAILGALGPEAQMAAIQAIPFSEAMGAQEELEQKQLRRGAAARGEYGSGATIASAADLGGAQVERRIQDRLSALQPLSQTEQGVASTLSGLQESGATRQAQILAGTGPQAANIRLGIAPQVVDARTAAANAQALQGLAQANQTSQLLGQLASFAGSFGSNNTNIGSTNRPMAGMTVNTGPGGAFQTGNANQLF